MAAQSEAGRRSFAVAVGSAGWAAMRTEIGKAARPIMPAAAAATRYDLRITPLPARLAIAAAARDRAAPLRSRPRGRSAERRARPRRAGFQLSEPPSPRRPAFPPLGANGK